MRNIRLSVLFGVIGGILTFLFEGWSVAVVGILMGISLGLAISGQLKRKEPAKLALDVLPSALVSCGILLILSLLQNYVITGVIGHSPAPLEVMIPANLIGVLGGALFLLITVALHGLSEGQERIGRLVLLGLVVIAFPFVDNFTQLGWTSLIIFSLIYVLLGMGLNIVVGYAGLLDLGYAAFFAIGAYTTGILSSQQDNITLNFWLVIWIAAAVAAVAGILLGAPTLRLRGDYLAIVTLGFGEIIPVIFLNLTNVTIKEPLTCWIIPGVERLFGATSKLSCNVIANNLNLTNGDLGINPIGRPALPFIGTFTSNNTVPWFFLIILIILLAIFGINRLRDSRLGRAWMAIREDELAASQMGIDPVRTKLLAFSMGATFSGFGGAFYGAYIAGVFPGAFQFSTSIIILCAVILGGIGNIYGVIVGGLVIETADRLFLPALKDFFTNLMNHSVLPALASQKTLHDIVAQNANPILYRYLLFGLVLVIMMAVRPEGLIPNAQRRMELHEAEEAPNVAASTSVKS
jgi:branched-chain amino acid transport system permease protein